MTATAQTELAGVFDFSPEHDELRATVRRFLADRSPEAEVRRLMDTDAGYHPAVWRQLAHLGLTGLLVPERHGGAGSGCVELQIVCEEMGRALLCAPFLSSAVLATSALLHAGDEAARARYLPGLADGSVIGTLAVTEESGSWRAEDVATRAEADGSGGYTLTGQKLFVLDAVAASLLLVLARTERGPSLFAVAPGAPGLAREPMATLDATRKQGRITLDATPATLVGSDGGAAAGLAAALDVAAAALAAEQAGGARRVLEMAVDYAKVREQFGRPIGSYQAIKHKCADMLLEVESATSAAYAAGWAVDARTDEVGVLASLAKAYCSEAYYHCAAENIQVHGGIGFTWEHPAHLYFKRATSTRILLGSPTYHRELLARRLGI
ncbi:MAG TPA: acyl-CoA dehydrogenase family protein [Pseudonocardia sp.]|uniref:acyl-CoA dehydrogenase family protein n=1 Tax=Pseudonocardia sp. TaxID=60912 RepID=UPI002C643AD1|nr:acyl-CoA dehydrogenase family protein [Pseudonocardia sp.]HTF47640.1 acyl-CoA dehydrogenase family protein [Pseudonocardia sp.]